MNEFTFFFGHLAETKYQWGSDKKKSLPYFRLVLLLHLCFHSIDNK